ncbi:MAG: serine/threonine protein kinase, partial [Acidobacteria bacterium]
MDEDRRTRTIAPLPAPGRLSILAPGSAIGERFAVLRVLGSGGWSVVYLAEDRELGRRVALKVLRADRLSDAAVTRFRREVAIARDASSPHLVRIYDLGTAGEAIYLSMEAIEGESLRQRLARGPLPVAEAAEVARQVLLGLGELHRLGIVHRDVKPANVLLAAGGTVKLADLGLARPFDRDATRATDTEALVGTLDYLSPEQALGEEVGPASDLYALGVVLYEMLAGELPHAAKTSLGTLIARVHRRSPDVRRRRPEVPARLAALLRRLLDNDPAERATAADALPLLARIAARPDRC